MCNEQNEVEPEARVARRTPTALWGEFLDGVVGLGRVRLPAGPEVCPGLRDHPVRLRGVGLVRDGLLVDRGGEIVEPRRLADVLQDERSRIAVQRKSFRDGGK